MGGSYPATLAAADEWAVARFAEGRISYLDIARTVEKCLDAAPDFGTDSIESTMEANDWTWKYLSR
jgi:1-deoxy-D-xylulose-5-phosphate reductoisomerase